MNGSHSTFCSVDLQQKQVDITYVSYQGCSEEQGDGRNVKQDWRLDRKERREGERKNIRKEKENVLPKMTTTSQLRSSQPLLRQSLKKDHHLKTQKFAN